MRARLAAAAVAVLALAATLAVPMPATAQKATGSVTLVSQVSFRTAADPFTAVLRIRTSTVVTGLEIAVGTYRRLGSRSELVNAIDGRLPTRTPSDLVRFPLEQLPVDSDGNSTLTLSPRAPRDGVYPVRIELRDTDGNAIDAFTTFFMTVPAVVEGDPLDVALVLPVHAPPSVSANGEVNLKEDRADAIADMAAVIAARTDVPMTIAPTPETLEALAGSTRAGDKDTAATLARGVTGHQVVGAPYVPVDIAAMVDENLGGELNAQLERGASATSNVLDVTAPGDLRVVDDPLDGAALGALEAQGVDRIVAPEATLEPVRLPNSVTLTGTFVVEGRRQPITAAAADAGLAAHFARDVPPALAAAELLADLTSLWLDLPGRSSARRGVVAMPSRDWRPDGPLLAAVIDGLTATKIFAPVTLDGFFEQVAPAKLRNAPLTRSFAPRAEASTIDGDAITAARRRLEGFASIVAPENSDLDLLDRTLLVGQSSDLRPSTRAAYVRGVQARISDQLRGIEMPRRRSITLTARDGELPVTVTRRVDYPVTVLVTLESDTLDFPGGASRTLELTHENTTERFEVQARASGSFPVQIRVTSPDGNVVIAESTFTVRSTAVSGVGIALSVGAALFLVVWWASHLRSRRRSEPVPA